MTTNQPLVSIGMPVYNGAQFIRDAFDALLAQSYRNIELIISDNASTDETQQICTEYVAKDDRIRYNRAERNMGAGWNFKRVLDLAQGEYFMWASCHDLWESTFLQQCVTLLQQEQSVVLCYPSADWIDLQGNRFEMMRGVLDTRGLDRIARSHVVLWGLQYTYPIYGVMRTDVVRQTKLFEKPMIGSDNLFLFELALLGEFAQLSEILFHIRQMPDYGSWDTYIEKMFLAPINGFSRKLLFWKMVFAYIRPINRHFHNLLARIGVSLSVMFGVFVKYREIRNGLAQKSRVHR